MKIKTLITFFIVIIGLSTCTSYKQPMINRNVGGVELGVSTIEDVQAMMAARDTNCLYFIEAQGVFEETSHSIPSLDSINYTCDTLLVTINYWGISNPENPNHLFFSETWSSIHFKFCANKLYQVVFSNSFPGYLSDNKVKAENFLNHFNQLLTEKYGNSIHFWSNDSTSIYLKEDVKFYFKNTDIDIQLIYTDKLSIWEEKLQERRKVENLREQKRIKDDSIKRAHAIDEL